VLSAYDEDLGEYARRSLENKGVEVRTNSVVTDIEADAVYVGQERIRTRNVVWAAGVTASPLGRALGVETDRVGRVMVQPDLSVPGHPEVFVVGDLMNLAGADGHPLPGVAQVAIQGGQAAARNIARTLRGEPRKPFKYFNKGNMATIGRRSAILQRDRFKLKGVIAWMGWLFVHIMFLIGYRNRMAVMLQWAWSYFTWQRGARLITGDVGADLAPPGKPLGTPEHEIVPPSEGNPMSRDVQQAHDQGQTVPAEPEGGWMGGDRAQAHRG
jgi:NADH dehydrogenase